MIELFKDRYKLGLLLAMLFFVGVIVSIYSIYSLPHKLMLTDGYQPSFTNVYIIVSLTFLIGALAIWYSLQQKNEVVVYRDKQLEKNVSEQDKTNESSQTTISLDSVKTNLRNAKTEKDILLAGLHTVCKQLEAGQGAIYLATEKNNTRKVELAVGYALSIGESAVIAFDFGEGLVGQSASGGKTLYVDEVPEGYIKIISGLGSASPRYLLIVPIKQEDRVVGVMEIASFTPVSDDQRKFVEESAQLIASSMSGNLSA
jgi:methyl-accepting chemotaxis protein